MIRSRWKLINSQTEVRDYCEEDTSIVILQKRNFDSGSLQIDDEDVHEEG